MRQPRPRAVHRPVLLGLVLAVLVAAAPAARAATSAAPAPTPAPAPAAPQTPATTAAGGEKTATTTATKPTPEDEAKGPLRGLEYRLVGPAIGGRATRVSGVPGDPLTWYAAAAAGGVWKSTDGGRDWSPIFDDQPVSSIGSIAVAPSDPNVVWVGTGEANVRGNVAKGNGVYRSTDAGKTWSHVLSVDGQIGTMAVDPRNADVAFAAVLGSPFGPGADRGVYRTTDGGRSWKKVLYVDDRTGASDVALDPHNARVVFAGMWQVRRFPWDLQSGGPGSSLWTSRDGGETWKKLTGSGLPDGIWGKVGVRVAPSDASRVYAVIEANDGGLFRSDDGGASWQHVNASRGIRQRAWYYSCLTIDPTKPDVVWLPQVSMLFTKDGGEHVAPVRAGGGDYHDVWIDPTDTRRIIVASDGGVSMSRDGSDFWHVALPIAQIYHISADNRVPYRVMGAAQDFGTVSGPSNSLHAGNINLDEWHGVGGGEAGHVVAEPDDPDVVYAGEYMGLITRYDDRVGGATTSHVGIYPDNGSGHAAADEKYRFQWTAPIATSPHDPKVIYHAGNVLFRTRDGGQHWEAISPDLTRNDKSKQKWTGGPITGDITGVEYYDTIFAVAESPLQKGLIWAGTDDGLVHVTRDDGKSWKNVTPKDMPQWATVQTVEPSHFDAGTAWLVADAHRLDDDRPYLWVTTDFGASWKSLARGLDARTWLHAVREDPTQRGLLYLATERTVQVSRDGGGSWQPLRLNLPTVAVTDLMVKGNDLLLSTLGRSIWILDDLTPVRQWSAPATGAVARLFPPPPTIGWALGQGGFGDDLGSTANPPAGVTFTYWVAPGAKQVKAEILDAQGKVIRTLSSEAEPAFFPPNHPDAPPASAPKPALSAAAGLHRASWDLAMQAPPFIPGARIDSGTPPTGPNALPGDYTLRLTVDGHADSQPLRLLPDPRITTPRADQEAQLAYLLRLRDRVTELVNTVAAIRGVREQLQARLKLLGDAPANADLVALGKQVVARLDAIEGELHNPTAEVTYDILAGRDGGAKLWSRYSWLYGTVQPHPGPPTQGALEVADQLDRELAAQEQAWAALQSGDLARLQAMAKERGVGFVTVPRPGV